ncbi:hypothetical protein HZH68_003438 [Vespula germanica]|uniref:Uncharacterized protein n=1 Tax=Vespula germanica TaxID=30212 RepID=A0A834NP44_VESGE|nr:hypothetical protein HZH68_003438 [Vespula germanica]
MMSLVYAFHAVNTRSLSKKRGETVLLVLEPLERSATNPNTVTNNPIERISYFGVSSISATTFYRTAVTTATTTLTAIPPKHHYHQKTTATTLSRNLRKVIKQCMPPHLALPGQPIVLLNSPDLSQLPRPLPTPPTPISPSLILYSFRSTLQGPI